MFSDKKSLKYPRQEKLRDFRNPHESYNINKECKYIRVMHNRKYRKNVKKLIKKGNFDSFHKPIHTSGWETT